MPRGTPGYFDWNDVALNALGAAFGVVLMLAMRGKRTERTFTKLPPMRLPQVGLVLCGMTLLSLALSPPVWTPFFSVTPGGRVFHKLAGSEGVIVAAALWAAVRYVAQCAAPARR